MPETYLQSRRREQLVELGVELLAEVGVEGTSFVRIAERAGVSRGVLHYHFAGRRALFEAVVDSVYALGAEEVRPAVLASGAPERALATFVRESVLFYARRPRELRALTAIFTSRSADGIDRETRPEHRAEMERVSRLLREGQATGRMRAFDVALMATTVRTVLDLAVGLVAGGAEAGPLGDELARTVLAMTGSEDEG